MNARTTRISVLTVAVGLLLAQAVLAQSIVDARRVEFTPSTDHAVLASDGTALVQSYSLDVFVAGSTQPSQTVSLGKPAPGTDGMIRLDFVSLLTTPLTPGVVYETRVSAVGPGGSSASLPSNTFGFTAPCAPAISPASQSIAAAGGGGTISVTAGPGCAWAAVSNAPWLTVSGGATGAGSGAVTFAVAATTSTTSRVGTLTVAGQTFTVTQAAAACSFSLSAASDAFAVDGGTGSVGVTSPAGCAWSAASNAAWVTITSGSSTTGSGTVAFTVAANATGGPRSATLTIAGQTFTIAQSGGACSYALSAPSQSFPATGGTGSVTLTTTPGCAWTVSGGAAWVSVVSGAGGSGSGTVTFNVAANTGATDRLAILLIGGSTFSISQSVTCVFFVSPTSLSPIAAGGTGTLTVSTQAGCGWGASSSVPWITASGSGTGSGTTSYTIAANGSTSSRTGTISVGGKTVSVTQAPSTTAVAPAAPANVRVVGGN